MYDRVKSTSQPCKVIKSCALHFQWSKDPWTVGSSNFWTSQNQPLWLLPASLHWTQTKVLWKPNLPGEWCSVWFGREEISLKDISKSNISSHHRWSAVDATLYDTTPIKLILREKSIRSAKNIVPYCCRMQRLQRSSSTMRHSHANLPYTNNCASDVISVDSSMANTV